VQWHEELLTWKNSSKDFELEAGGEGELAYTNSLRRGCGGSVSTTWRASDGMNSTPSFADGNTNGADESRSAALRVEREDMEGVTLLTI